MTEEKLQNIKDNNNSELRRLIMARKNLEELKKRGYSYRDIVNITNTYKNDLAKYSDYDGNIYFKEVKSFKKTKIDLLDRDFIKILVLSDIHLGNEYTNESFLNDVYTYAERTGIHHVFICGDIIDVPNYVIELDTTDTCFWKNVVKAKTQAEYAIEKIPKYKNIVTHVLLGNHDFIPGGYFEDILKTEREDVVFLGYGESKNIWIGDKAIKLSHPAEDIEQTDLTQADIYLRGHSHWFNLNSDYPVLDCKINSLSGLRTGDLSEAGFAELEMKFENGKCIESKIRDMIISENIFGRGNTYIVENKRIRQEALVKKIY